jgi:hypothetical protein
MEHLPKDRRGYPIPVIVARDKAGEPLFTINDGEAVERQMAECTCGICGGVIELGHFHFVGGPASAFHPQGGFYIDGPLHHECATYAMQVCPYIAAPHYGKSVDWRPALKNGVDFSVAVDQTMLPDRPPCFVVVRTVSYNVTWPMGPFRKFIPIGELGHPRTHPSSRMVGFEVWVHGSPIENEERAMEIIREGLEAVEQQTPRAPKLQRVASGLDQE